MRTGKESAIEEITDLQQQLEKPKRQSGDFSAEQAKRKADDDPDHGLHELERCIEHILDDIDRVSQGPWSFEKDEEHRKLKLELFELLHEGRAEALRKIEECEWRTKGEKDAWAIERNHSDDEDTSVYSSQLCTIDRQAMHTGTESVIEDIAERQWQLEKQAIKRLRRHSQGRQAQSQPGRIE